MSEAISVPNSTALKQGGLLFNLPPELRNEIYRYLVKGNYVLSGPPKLLFEVAPVSRVRPHLNILLVSKTIRNEAMAVLYSESRFRIHINFSPDEVSRLSALEPFEHMMKVGLNVCVPHPSLGSEHRVQQCWKAILECIGLEKVFRKIICIRWRLYTFRRNTIPKWMLQELDSLIQTQEVVLSIDIPCLETTMGVDNSYKYKQIESEIKNITHFLAPVLGPAAVGHVFHPGHPEYAKTLTFHPCKNRAIILRGRAKLLRSEADMLDRVADRLDREADKAEANVGMEGETGANSV